VSSEAADLPAPKARTGRPRADARQVVGDPREEIVAVASRLFARKGVAGTTMSEIAHGAGLRQSSVYYYFRDKEAILGEILGSVNRAILDELERIQAAGGPPALRLYKLIRHDARTICAFPFDINEVYRLAALQDERFRGFWSERDSLNEAVEGIIAEGIAAGELIDTDPRLAALVVLSNDEGTQNWFRPFGDLGQTGSESYDADSVATFLADMALGALLRDRRRLPALRHAARGTSPQG
jgi:TetR/AcrR family transcriptional regulator